MSLVRFLSSDEDKLRIIKLSFAVGVPADVAIEDGSIRENSELFSKVFKFEKITNSEETLFDSVFKRLLKTSSEGNSLYRCPACANPLYFNVPTNFPFYRGFEAPNNFTNYSDFLDFSDMYGIRRVFFPGIGIVESSNTRINFYLNELDAGEKIVFIFDQFEVNVDKFCIVSSVYDEFAPFFFTIESNSQTVLEVQLPKFCKSCGFEEQHRDSVKDISEKLYITRNFNLKFDQSFQSIFDDLNESSENIVDANETLAKVIRLLVLIGLGKLNLRSKISELSKSQLYIINLFCDSAFDESNTVYLHRFPVFEEFEKSSVDRLIEDNIFTIDECLLNAGKSEFRIDGINYSLINVDQLMQMITKNSQQLFLVNEFIPLKISQNLKDPDIKGKPFLFDAIDDFETDHKLTNSSIFTYLGFADEVSKLYSSHPVSLRQGFGNNEFLYTKSKFVCSQCAGHGTNVQGSLCAACGGRRFLRILDQVKWKGLSIGDMMIEPFKNFTQYFAPVIARLSMIIDLLNHSSLGKITVGEPVSNFKPIELFTLRTMRYFLREQQANDVVFIESVGYFLKCPDFSTYLSNFTARLIQNGVTVVLRNCK